MGPTLVWYHLGVGAASEETTAALPSAAVGGAAATGGAAAGAAKAGAAELESPARGGEEQRTWGRKALPSQVFTVLKPEKENKWGGGLQKLEMGCEMKKKKKKKGFI